MRIDGFMKHESTGNADPEAVLQELEAILGSEWFRKTTSLKDFLRFVVEQTLAGREGEIKEYVIGHEVFHRPQEYDPRSDAIVRVQARLLRQKLDLYYQNTVEPRVRIELPKGGYVPVFTVHSPVNAEEQPHQDGAGAEADAVPPSPLPKLPSQWFHPVFHGHRSPWLGIPVLAAILLTAFAGRALYRAHFSHSAPPAVPCPLLWGPLLEGKAPTTIILGAPNFFSLSAGLLVRDVTVNSSYQMEHGNRLHEVSHAIANSAAPPQPANFYTGVGEALGAERLNRLFWEHARVPALASSGHVLSTHWSQGNLIVVSSLRIQTLINQLHLPSDFVRLGDTENVILNLHPREGEQARYVDETTNNEHIDYGLISVWPGLSPGRRIVLLGGDDTYGTEAVVNFATDSATQHLLQKRLTALGAVASPSLAFQVLLRIKIVQGTVVRSIECIAVHVLSQPEPIMRVNGASGLSLSENASLQP